MIHASSRRAHTTTQNIVPNSELELLRLLFALPLVLPLPLLHLPSHDVLEPAAIGVRSGHVHAARLGPRGVVPLAKLLLRELLVGVDGNVHVADLALAPASAQPQALIAAEGEMG
jgi:hypothetical protein